jgi:flagellar basal body rod protein FlgC
MRDLAGSVRKGNGPCKCAACDEKDQAKVTAEAVEANLLHDAFDRFERAARGLETRHALLRDKADRLERRLTDAHRPLEAVEPGHPDADAAGFVAYPNVNPVEEMVDMLSATRSYEANVTMVRSIRDMARSALQILR